jgi:hypothetical protein
VDINDLPDIHIRYSRVKAFDHHTSAAHKLKRFSTIIRGVKLCAVVESAAIMRSAGFPDILSLLFCVAVSVSAIMLAASVVMTAVSFSMVIAVCPGIDKFPAQIRFHRLIRIPICPGTEFYASFREGRLSTSADAAADQDIDFSFIQQSRKRTVSTAV